MKQIIEIEVPDGKTAIWKDGRVYFIDKPLKLPKTWEEYCKANPLCTEEYYIGGNSEIVPFRKSVIGERDDTLERNLLATEEDAKAHRALMQLHRLRDCYRQGWKPNFAEDSQKWYILKNHDKLSVDWNISYSVFLNFQTREIAEQFLNNFKDLIEQAGDLI